MHDGSNFDIYIDGVQDSVTWSGTGGPLAYVSSGTLYARAGNSSDGTAPFNGEIDELLLFQRALTPSEVIDLPEPGLIPGLGAGVLFLIAVAHRRR